MPEPSKKPSDQEQDQSETGPPTSKRRRIGLACNACRSRKSRCDGQRPSCSSCLTLGFDCLYEPGDSATNVIVRKDYRLNDVLNGHLSPCTNTNTSPCHHGSINVGHSMPSPAPTAPTKATAPSEAGTGTCATSLEEPQDEEGIPNGMAMTFVEEKTSAFYGEASNINFTQLLLRAIAVAHHSPGAPSGLDRASVLGESVVASVIQTKGSLGGSATPIDSLPTALPSVDEMDTLLDLYFDTAGVVFPFIHEETMRKTYNECRLNGFTRARRTWLGTLNMVFAMASNFDRDYTTSSKKRFERSNVFYKRAKEYRRRTWVVIFCLDKVLSTAVGRPASIPDEQMTRREPASGWSPANSGDVADLPGDFLAVSFKMYQVMSKSLAIQYGANLDHDSDPDEMAHLKASGELRKQLRLWAANLPPHLQLCDVESDALLQNTKANRLRVILTMRYHNLSILIHKPLLSATIRHLFRHDDTANASSSYLIQLAMAEAHECVRSAQLTIDIVHSVISVDCTSKNNLGVWYFTLYYETGPDAASASVHDNGLSSTGSADAMSFNLDNMDPFQLFASEMFDPAIFDHLHQSPVDDNPRLFPHSQPMARLEDLTALTQLPEESARVRYTPSELQDYFKTLKFPQRFLDLGNSVLKDPSLARTKEHGLPLLQAITRYHTCNVPFENLVLHYDPQKIVTLDPAELYTKIVTRRRGGRCMENNIFLGTALRSLGYEVRNCGGRVSRAMSPYSEVRKNQSATYDGWNHMLLLVFLGDEWYGVDVGMGSMGPNLPFPLQDGFESLSIAPREIRIQKRSIPETYATGPSHGTKMWCYDVCYNPAESEMTWTPVYCFTETEFLPQDYEVMSWFTSTNPRSFFTRYITCTKMIMDEDKEVIIGNLTLFKDTVRETIGSDRKVVKKFETEEERIQGLVEIFDVNLTEEEKNSLPEEKRLG
ncbi:arylamine N-acetyltransferase [Fusarium agapanthi]|uniref:Arylamine N-acetyltransferase n=1 Tax=Fusarium agapanthi TaxID=1803897 RepID=A0A9P5E5X8_9HYPO|nr:arylamine N-acetyltransferase [Fusarium agapanthi]